MTLGNLSFLCLNAICIGALALVVLGAFMRMYGRRSPYTQTGSNGPIAGRRSPTTSRLRTVDPDALYMDRKGDGGGRRRVGGDVRREVSYEYE
ncbi:MAG TPA: hypothetical protein VK879_11190 [Candidatus Sulfomarinibacteraceae bacterium]|nr:hypothetical protein [Candidatus Sulfomarinibacteraceae bacterium]